ncbi:MAG: hypothetical protein ABJA64_02520 [Candidatus Saccharibacteria bacterium]
MSYNDYRALYILLVKIFTVFSVVGVAVLVYTNFQDDPSAIAFPLIAFIISVAALVMTTLQSLSIAKQVRITERAARLVDSASDSIKALVNEDQKMEYEIREDLKLDHEIIAILEEHGIGDNETDRKQVAKKIAAALKH